MEAARGDRGWGSLGGPSEIKVLRDVDGVDVHRGSWAARCRRVAVGYISCAGFGRESARARRGRLRRASCITHHQPVIGTILNDATGWWADSSATTAPDR
jgi:hypothetical protein